MPLTPEQYDHAVKSIGAILYATLCKRHSKEDANDICQKAFLTLWEKHGDFRGEHGDASIRRFLFDVAGYEEKNMLRKKRNIARLVNELEQAKNDDNSPGLSGDTPHRSSPGTLPPLDPFFQNDLTRAIERLDPIEELIIHCHYGLPAAGDPTIPLPMTDEKIARLLSTVHDHPISREGVTKRRHRALIKLRALLDDAATQEPPLVTDKDKDKLKLKLKPGARLSARSRDRNTDTSDTDTSDTDTDETDADEDDTDKQ